MFENATLQAEHISLTKDAQLPPFAENLNVTTEQNIKMIALVTLGNNFQEQSSLFKPGLGAPTPFLDQGPQSESRGFYYTPVALLAALDLGVGPVS